MTKVWNNTAFSLLPLLALLCFSPQREKLCRPRSPFVVAVGSRPFGVFGVNLIVSWDVGWGARKVFCGLDFYWFPGSTLLVSQKQAIWNRAGKILKLSGQIPFGGTYAAWMSSSSYWQTTIVKQKKTTTRVCWAMQSLQWSMWTAWPRSSRTLACWSSFAPN